MLQAGGCNVKLDFHVLDTKGDPHKTLILGLSFIAIVGAIADFRNQQFFLSKIDKRAFYPAVPVNGSYCRTIYTDEIFEIEAGDGMKKV